MNGEWRGRCLFKGLLPGFGEGAELNGVTAAPTSACLGLKGGREPVISSDKLQTSQPLAMKGALGSADKSRRVSCLSALIGLGFVCRPVSARLAAPPGSLPRAKREGSAGVRSAVASRGAPISSPHRVEACGAGVGRTCRCPPSAFCRGFGFFRPFVHCRDSDRAGSGAVRPAPRGAELLRVPEHGAPRAPSPLFVLPPKTLLSHSPTARAAGSCSRSQPPRILTVGSGHRIRVNGPPLSPSWWGSRKASRRRRCDWQRRHRVSRELGGQEASGGLCLRVGPWCEGHPAGEALQGSEGQGSRGWPGKANRVRATGAACSLPSTPAAPETFSRVLATCLFWSGGDPLPHVPPRPPRLGGPWMSQKAD
ncbi:cold shock domain-containing protein C2 isoform X1 [Cygnus olor]|uniref:cold shock domain-containing protein C2 isoform X1 n=1 Tax=Cygnus olor TaxID=8869 RepID=UPI001ADE0BB7|nr:cold shock domain-containing protein C2 isoform X1 [Cygnus olor]